MSLYAIGDVQGCFNALERLLGVIDFDPDKDELWFAGDLVNRGTQSLETLRFIKDLGDRAVCVLGNHDLRLLRVDSGIEAPPKDGTLAAILDSPQRPELMDWLRHRPLFKLDEKRKLAMVHAGLLPSWDLQTARTFAREVESRLQADDYKSFLAMTKERDINSNRDTLTAEQQRLFVLNIMIHIRVCNEQEQTLFSFKRSLKDRPTGFSAWFEWPHQRDPEYTVIIGHWAALGFKQAPGILALDSGCVWGRQLTAYRLDAGKEKRFSVECA